MRTIAEDQILARMAAENPWWTAPETVHPIYDRFSPRAYFDLFLPLVAQMEVQRAVLLMGPRRVGKTVMLHHAVRHLIDTFGVEPQEICFVSVDHPIYNGLGLEQLLSFLSQASGFQPTFVFFDEIQYLREWEVHLKTLVDSHQQVQFVASGSAAAALRLKSTESGAGRFTDFMLPPLTFYEYLQLLGRDDSGLSSANVNDVFLSTIRPSDMQTFNENFLDYINFGGYPEAIFSEQIQADPGRFIKSDIIDKVLLRDLPSLYGIQDIQELNSLFTTLAYNTANEISLEELSQNSGVAKQTIKRYMVYLEAAFLIKKLFRIDQTGKTFKRANFFKTYLTTPSIRSALFAPLGFDDSAMGPMVETAILSQWFHSPTVRQIHYARWRGGEVDIVYLETAKAKPSWAVEVKWSDRFVSRPTELTSLISFANRHKLAKPLVTTRTKSGRALVGDLELHFAPASVYCYVLGRNIIQAAHATHWTATSSNQPNLPRVV